MAESTLEDWLPDYRVVSSEGSITEEGQILACDRVYVPSQFSGFGSLTVLTFDLEESLTLGDGASTFAAGETIYASHQNLYVATNTWFPQPFFDDDDWLRDVDRRYRTSLHKFSLTPGGPAVYEASGSVKGHLLNQFSLHEHDGHLFVAVTDGSPWRADRQSESLIFALAQQDDVLAVVGGVGDMGRGERIYSVRYIGDRAYVVTFRQVDPLYVVDLSRSDRACRAGRAEDPGLLGLPAPRRRRAAGRNRPGHRRGRPHPRLQGVAVRRVRSGRARARSTRGPWPMPRASWNGITGHSCGGPRSNS